jgi:hypothetical protein
MKNWMTTVAGLVSAAASFVLFAGLGGMMTFPKPVMAIALFAQVGGLAAFGVVAKQYNVTGGTSGQPSSTRALLDANQQRSQNNPPKE